MNSSSISNGSRSGTNSANSSDKEGEEDSDGDDSNSTSSSDEDDESRAGRAYSVPATEGKPTSTYRGVYFHRNKRLWEACITVGGKNLHAGRSKDEEEDARAHDTRALELFARPILIFDPVSGQRNKECKLDKHLGALPAALPYLGKRAASSSSYRGVILDKRRKNSWQATVIYSSGRIYLGNYETEEKAAWAHDSAVSRYFGRPVLNFYLTSGASNPDRKDDVHRQGCVW